MPPFNLLKWTSVVPLKALKVKLRASSGWSEKLELVDWTALVAVAIVTEALAGKGPCIGRVGKVASRMGEMTGWWNFASALSLIRPSSFSESAL